LTDTIVVDASPLIVLIKIDLSFVLNELFSTVIVPASVYAEILAGPPDDKARLGLPDLAWLRAVSCDSIDPRIDTARLGKGEADVLSLALGENDASVLVDDAAARRAASALGICCFGTGGLIVRAKQRGVIRSVSDALSSAKDNGLWIGVGIEREILEMAGENDIS